MSEPVGGIKKSTSTHARRVIAYIVLIILSILCLFWFYILLIYSTRSTGEIQKGITFIPSSHFVENFKNLINSSQPVFQGLRNSLVIACSSALLSTYFSTLTAYAIHVYDFKLKKFIFTFILMIMMVPTQVTVLGFIQLMTKMKLINNFIPLIVPSIAAPVTFYYLKQYMESALPLALIEAARIDGCGYVQTWMKVIFPIARPGIMTAAVLAFLNNWNEYYWASLVLITREKLTVPALLSTFTTAFNTNYNGLFSAMVIIILPPVLLYCIFSRFFIEALSGGAVKG